MPTLTITPKAPAPHSVYVQQAGTYEHLATERQFALIVVGGTAAWPDLRWINLDDYIVTPR